MQFVIATSSFLRLSPRVQPFFLQIYSLSCTNIAMSISQNNSFKVNRVIWQEAENDLRMLRDFVFIREQGIPPKLEWDGQDKNCIHILIRDKKNRPIGTGRITKNGYIGHMAILRAWRGQRVGSAILTALITIAQARQLPRVQLDAQTQAIDFYTHHKFKTQGEVFIEADIPYQHMTRLLPSLDEHTSIRHLQDQKLGESKGYIDLHSRNDNQQAALRMAQQGQHSLHLFTPNLDQRVFDTEEFIEAIKQLALASPRSKVCILIIDPSAAVSRGHRIIELARRISSHIHIHRADPEDQNRVDTFMIVDKVGIIRRAHNDRFDGLAEFNNPGEARLLLKAFNDAWERSHPEPELRRLHL